ncbi:MAG TPA: DUF6705 family protein [Flavobacterium sp.]|nr:DUF6705 family protein [Flavobacterium sp.]
MKKILSTVLLFTVLIDCKAQSYDLYNSDYGSVNNGYYQDLNNLLDPYIGTWTFDNGSENFTITLLKKKMYTNGALKYYEDVIVGEYRYVQNNEEKVNTLSLLDANYNSKVEYNLYGNLLISNEHIPQCTTCAVNEKRLKLQFNEPNRDYIFGPKAVLILKISNANGLPIIKATLYKTTAADTSTTAV